MDLKEFGQKLAKIRQAQGLSAYALSLRIEKDPSYIHKVENARMNISLRAFFAICKALEMTPQEFFNA